MGFRGLGDIDVSIVSSDGLSVIKSVELKCILSKFLIKKSIFEKMHSSRSLNSLNGDSRTY